jgi:vacuolar-type H+-ATPase subunit H
MDTTRSDDVFYLLDRLEEVLGAGRSVPFSARKLVDEQECLDILDQIRVSVPEELRAAKRLTQERQRIVEDARLEADRVLQDAEHRLAERVADHELVRAAEMRAVEIEEDALRSAEGMRREVDDYAFKVLSRLRDHVQRVTEAVDRGLEDFSDQELAPSAAARR